MKQLSFILAIIALTGASLIDEVRLRYFDVEREDNAIVLKWETEVENGARTFELFRKTSQAVEFTLVGSSEAHGVNRPYAYTDTQVYKSPEELIDYKLEVVFNSGLRQVLAERKFNYTPTALRRSWGSIKAMFQD